MLLEKNLERHCKKQLKDDFIFPQVGISSIIAGEDAGACS